MGALKQNTKSERFDKQRNRVMVRACQLFQKREFSSLTIDDLCASLKMNKASFYRYFESKEELLFAIHSETLRAATDALAEIVAGTDQALTRLKKAMISHVLVVNAPSHSHITIPQVHMFSGKRRKQVIEQRDVYERMLVALVEEGIKEGTIQTEHPKLTVLLFLSTLNHIILWFKKGGHYSLEEIAQYAVNHAIDGLRAPAPCKAAALDEPIAARLS